MRTRTVLFAALCCAAPSLLPAQNDKKPPAPNDKKPAAGAEMAMPDPKTKEHDALAAFTGHWDASVKMQMPGTDKPNEAKGTETAELICNGLFVKSVVNATVDGKPFQGIWVGGYNPFSKNYETFWVDVETPSAAIGTGKRDAAKNTWDFHTAMATGEVHSVVTFKDADHFTETSYMKGADGKEEQMMEITRTRSKAPKAEDAAAKVDKAPTKEHAELLKMVGDWDAVVRFKMAPEAPWTEEKGTMHATAMCGGTWVWSDFKGQMMGAPFEGHGLDGYDTTKKEYVGWWIDTMSPVAMISSGKYDATKKGIAMEGKCLDPTTGKPMTSKLFGSWVDDNTHLLKMQFTDDTGTHDMEITYKRKK